MIEAAAKKDPRALAVIAGEAQLDYAALAELARRATHLLDGRAPIAFVGRTELATIALILAAIERGAPVVPIHPRWTINERERFLGSLGAVRFLERIELGDPATIEAQGIDPEAPLAWFATSGTTGTPKLVELSRRAFIASAAGFAARIPWSDDDRWLLDLPLAHVGGFSILVRSILANKAIVLSPGFDPSAFRSQVIDRRITIVSVVPTMLRRILDADSQPAPSSLKAVIVGGAAARPALLDEARARGFPIVTTYGLTEMASMVTLGEPSDRGYDAGRPLDRTEVRIVDGEIEVRGPTAKSNHRGWLSTGDLGALDDQGRLTVTGRKSELIITGGENVHPTEVEAVLGRIPGVRDACVIGVDDPLWGEIVAVGLVLGPGFDPTLLERTIEAELAPFKRPRRFARVEAIPEGNLGKRDRVAAKKLITAGLGTLAALVSHLSGLD
jgi:o-succinylbenzoate---CoA ligase